MGRFYTGMRGPDAIRKFNELDDAIGGALAGAGELVEQAFGYRNQAEAFAAQAQTAAGQVLAGVQAAEAAAGIATAAAAAAGQSATSADEAEQAAGQSATAARDDAIAADASEAAAAQHAVSAAASSGTAGTARGEAVQAAIDAGAAADEAEGYRDTIVTAITNYGNGWTPVFAVGEDGERRVLGIVDWFGGTGVKPAIGFISATGTVTMDPSLAVNVRGAAGASGGSGTVTAVLGVAPGSDGNVTFQIADIPGLQEALAAAGQVKSVAGVLPGVDGDVPLTAADVGADAAGTAESEVAILADGLAPVAMSGSWNDVEDRPAVIGAGATQQAAREALGLGSVDNVGAANLRDRSTHTGEQAISTITGLQAALDATVASSDVGDLELLTTTAKCTVVDAINEVDGKTGGTGVVYRPIVVQEKSAAIAASNIDFSVAAAQTKTITAATTFTVSNAPPAGMVGCAILDLTNGGAFTLTFPAGSKWAAGTKPTFTTAGRDKLAVMTVDGGVTLDWLLLAGDMK